MSEQPERSTCPDCGGDGQAHNPCICPGWVSVDEMPHADLKALLADDDLSMGVPQRKEPVMSESTPEAIAAAAAHLPHSGDCEVRPERDCTCWYLRTALMRDALSAAAPYLVREAQAAELAAVEWAIDAELQDAPAPNYEEDNYEAGYVAGLAYAQDLLRSRIRAAAIRDGAQ